MPVNASQHHDHVRRELAEIIGLLRQQNDLLSNIASNMIPVAQLNTSLTNLTAAVTAATAAITNAAANSTPDAQVLQFQQGVDAQTAALNAAVAPPAPAPAPAPPA